MSGTVHIVGAGLAGLSTAVRLVEQGQRVALYEALKVAGGRCRTFADPRLGRDVDNGNHLLLSGNGSARDYLRLIGAADAMRMGEAAFPFVDLATGARWRVALGQGRVPWWIADRRRRVPGTGIGDYLAGWRLLLAGAGRTVAEAIPGRGRLWQRFWEPLTLAALNTTPERGAAPLLRAVLAETFARGGRASRPMFAPRGLGRALVDPAVAHLSRHGVPIAYEHALKGVTNEGDRLAALHFANGRTVALGPADRAVLALPPTRLKAVLPWIVVPADDAAILNAHFVVDDPADGRALAAAAPVTGLVNATTHWIFVRGDTVSLTVSAADRLGLMERAPDELIPVLWDETRRTLGLSAPYRAARVNKERRATFDQSPSGISRRPHARTPLANLVLAGDATATGLPATIEGAIRSGETAAGLTRLAA
jgi:squalene-associated FAD-dependent desaturase